MYNNYFGFSEKPFTIAPNPQFLFMSPRHQEALAHMLYGMQGEGGVMVLTGEVGTGKTTICRRLLEQIPENTNVAYIINPRQSETEMLASICDELHIACENTQSIKCLTDVLNQYLLDTHAKGQHTVLIIDEAQNLETSVLEQLRLLTNLETNDKKLLQIMLLGQPELADVLARKELRQLAQRITSRYHLTPLNKEEVREYIKHRLEVAGCSNQTIFPAATINMLYQYSGGVPRLINLIADRALLGAYTLEKQHISKQVLQKSRNEVLGTAAQPQTLHRPWLWLLTLILFTTIYWVWAVQPLHQPTPQPSTATIDSMQKPVFELSTPPEKQATKPKTSVPQPEKPNLEMVQATAIPTVQTLPTTQEQYSAFIPVFKAWGIDYNPAIHGDACEYANTNGLLCLRQKGDIADMRGLNRPAVLSVANQAGQMAYTAVLEIGGTTMQVATQDAYAEITLQQLALQSFNDFILLWKAPTGYKAPVRPGHQGALVAYLAEQVTNALNQSWIGAPRTMYDETLKEQVKILQRKEGLNPDGVAGPITWIHINRLNHIDAPNLNKVTP